MTAGSATKVTGDNNTFSDFRRLFLVHVVAVVLTAAIVVMLLFGIGAIPSWLSVAICLAIAAVSISFVAVSTLMMREDREIRMADRVQCFALTLGLSMLQAVFVLPVLICIFAPTFRA